MPSAITHVEQRAVLEARVPLLTGRTLADLLRNMFVVLVMLIVGLVVGFRASAGE